MNMIICVNPKLFYYYGHNLCSTIELPDYKSKDYNTQCDRGHIFISYAFECSKG